MWDSRDKYTEETQIQKASENRMSLAEIKLQEPKEEKREYNILQGGRKNSYGKNNKLAKRGKKYQKIAKRKDVPIQ